MPNDGDNGNDNDSVTDNDDDGDHENVQQGERHHLPRNTREKKTSIYPNVIWNLEILNQN